MMSHPAIISSQDEIFAVTNFTAVSMNNKRQLMPSNVSVSAASDHLTSCSFLDNEMPASVPVNNNEWLY